MYGHMGWTLPAQQLHIKCQLSYNSLHVSTGTSLGREEKELKEVRSE
jgi:hypothetical protein